MLKVRPSQLESFRKHCIESWGDLNRFEKEMQGERKFGPIVEIGTLLHSLYETGSESAIEACRKKRICEQTITTVMGLRMTGGLREQRIKKHFNVPYYGQVLVSAIVDYWRIGNITDLKVTSGRMPDYFKAESSLQSKLYMHLTGERKFTFEYIRLYFSKRFSEWQFREHKTFEIVKSPHDVDELSEWMVKYLQFCEDRKLLKYIEDGTS